MILKNITDNAKSLATSAKIEDMSRIFKSHIAAKQDVKNVLSGVMVSIWNIPFDNIREISAMSLSARA